MVKKFGFMIVALLMAGILSGEISSEEVTPAPSPFEHSSHSQQQSETEMSPSPSPSDYESISPTMSQPPVASDLKYTDVTRTVGEKSSGGTGIAVVAIAAASLVCIGGYMLKKRRDNLRRSRYQYAATEFF